jgi:alpha-1,6-mannosyltransferase
MSRLGILGGLILALTLVGLSLHQPGAITLPSVRVADVFVALAAASGVVYLFAVRETLRRTAPRGAVFLVLAIALALRLSVLFAPPFMSSDVFRYVWDGKVQVAGINPYRYVPADPALARLRDATIYPDVNRPDTARTIYPPMAQAVFRLVARISPTVLAMKMAMVGFELLAIGAMLLLLDLARLPRTRVLIYAWNPLSVWSFAGNGHVDALAIGLIGLALLARGVRRDGIAGALLGGAVAVKFLPAAMGPALWRRWDWWMPAACVATIAALYLCYIGAGRHVLGFLPGYAAEEGLDRGSGFWLLAGLGEVMRLTPGMVAAYEALALASLASLAFWIALRSRPLADPGEEIVRVAGNAAVLAAATMVAVSPHYSWYFAWLALPCCLSPWRGVIYLSVAGLLLDLNPWDEHFVWAALLYVPAIVLVVLDLRRPRASRIAAPAGAVGRSL